jgi:hypothetical protein
MLFPFPFPIFQACGCQACGFEEASCQARGLKKHVVQAYEHLSLGERDCWGSDFFWRDSNNN